MVKKRANRAKAKWIAYPLGAGLYRWWRSEDTNKECQEGTIKKMACELEGGSVAFVWPASLASIHQVSFSESEKKHLYRTVPYALEEILITDVEELHFSFSTPVNNEIMVATVNRKLIEQLIDETGRYDLNVVALWPEQLLIPVSRNGLTLWLNNGYCIVRCAKKAGFALEIDALPIALKCLQDELESIPEKVDLYCQDSDESILIRTLPVNFRTKTNRRGDKSLLSLDLNETMIDLLQGDYEKKVVWGEEWRFFRWPVILLFLVVGLNFGYEISENIRLKKINALLIGEVEAAFRTAIPQGVMAEPELQLKRLVMRNQAGSDSDVLGFIYQFGKVLKDNPAVILKSISYSESKDEFQLYILANAFTEVESLREALQSEGLQADLEGSSIENAKTLARLSVRRIL